MVVTFVKKLPQRDPKLSVQVLEEKRGMSQAQHLKRSRDWLWSLLKCKMFIVM